MTAEADAVDAGLVTVTLAYSHTPHRESMKCFHVDAADGTFVGSLCSYSRPGGGRDWYARPPVGSGIGVFRSQAEALDALVKRVGAAVVPDPAPRRRAGGGRVAEGPAR